MIAFVQPFGLNSQGGGPRIMRALVGGDHRPALIINTGAPASPFHPGPEEIHLPLRPSVGQLERSRFHRQLRVLDGVFSRRFEDSIRRVFRQRQVKLIHTIPHTYDIVPVIKVASELNIPYVLNVHDDLEYASYGHPLMRQMRIAMGQGWRDAKGLFVISDEMGKEYSRRYGARQYEIVTDGLTSVAESPQSRPSASLRVYFMGLYHMAYSTNFRAVLDALKIVRIQHPAWDISMTCRCGSIHVPVNADDVPVHVLPFAPESEVEKDMLSADLLYLPLPFQAEALNFGRFSLSTKLITYLGSGLPVLYHGPQDAAANTLLADHGAGVTCTTLDVEMIARQLIAATTNAESIVKNALTLARSRFMLADNRGRFWKQMDAMQ